MFRPAFFREERAEVLSALMRAAPFAHLVLATEAGLEANGLPLLLREPEDGWVLAGHVARSNPVWQMDVRGEALAIFSGPQGYVTPSAYASKKQHGKVVPTWNYSAVHFTGRVTVIHDAEWLREAVSWLTDLHEARREAAGHEAWSVDDAPDKFVAGQLRAIVGIQVEVEKVEAKRKLSQNRSEADRTGVVAGLRSERAESTRGEAQVADRMAGDLGR